MSKVKSKNVREVSQPKAAVLSKVKNGAVAKPSQNTKAKSRDLAKQVAAKQLTDKKRKLKEPEPSSEEDEEESEDESDEADDQESDNEEDDSSEEDSEDEAAHKAPPVAAKANKAASTAARANGIAEADTSDESASSEDDDDDEDDSEIDNVKISASLAGKANAEDDSEESDDSEDADSDSDDEVPVKKSVTETAARTGVKHNGKADADEDDDDSEEDEDSDDDEEDDDEDDDDEDEDEDEDEDDDEKDVKASSKVTAPKRKFEEEVVPAAKKAKVADEEVTNGSNLFVGNLSWNVTEEWLREEFEEFGELAGVRLITDRNNNNRSKGYGYVEFVAAADAARAYEAKRGSELDGRPLNLDYANARPDNGQKQENRRKSYGDQVGEPTDTLFMGNLSFDVGQETVSEAFAPYGTIQSVRLPTDRETGAPKGYGYVTFASIDDAKQALAAMQGAFIANRPVRLDYSTPRAPQDGSSPARGGGFGGRFGRGGFNDRGGRGGGRGGRGSFNDRGGRGGGRGGRGGSTNRGGFGDFSGKKTTF